MPEINYDDLRDQLAMQLRLKLARHEKVGASITLAEGETLINELSLDLIRSIRQFTHG